jgi:hypothetical protein
MLEEWGGGVLNGSGGAAPAAITDITIQNAQNHFIGCLLIIRPRGNCLRRMIDPAPPTASRNSPLS